MFKTIAIVLMAVIVVFAAPEPKADPKPGVVGYSAPLVSAYSPSAVYERSYHGNFAYPYASAPLVASPYVSSPYVSSPYVASPYVASPYAASPYYTSPVLFR